MKKPTAEWVRKAEADFVAAERLAGARPPVHDPLCFHCQQTAEKYLKALLSEHGIAVPKAHDLDVLLNLVLPRQPRMASLRRIVNTLTQYAVEYRYPGLHASSRQARSALRHATRVREQIRHILGLPVRKK
jgi:HEPN domain-containing protein